MSTGRSLNKRQRCNVLSGFSICTLFSSFDLKQCCTMGFMNSFIQFLNHNVNYSQTINLQIVFLKKESE